MNPEHRALLRATAARYAAHMLPGIFRPTDPLLRVRFAPEHRHRLEALIDELRSQFSVVIVTHSMQQAARVSQKTAFFHLGNLVEYGATDDIFTRPQDPRTESYISGRIG